MKIRSYTKIINGRFTLEVYTEDFSQGDEDLMAKFGEPEVNVGGDFTELVGGEEFSLPASYRKIRSDFKPWRFAVDEDDSSSGAGEAEDRVKTVRAAIEARIAAAVEALRSREDTFTAENITNV